MSNNDNGHRKEEDALKDTVKTTTTPHTLIHESELVRLPPVNWLIDQVIPEGKLCVLFGAPGIGKSFAALDFGLQVAQSHPVVYVAAEGFSGYSERRSAWYKHHKKPTGQMYFSADPVLLMDASNVDSFILTVRAISPKLIILDTLAWCMTGGDENSARDMQIVISACRRIQQETGATVMPVHHTVKRGSSERGSSALRGGADMMLELIREDNVLTLSCSKSKDTEPFAPKHLKLMKLATDQGSSCVIMPAEKVADIPDDLTPSQREILEQLSLQIFLDAGMRSNQIIAAVNLAPSTIYKVLSQLVQKNLIKQHKKGDPFYITDKGKELIDA